MTILKALIRPVYHRLYRWAVRVRCRYEDSKNRDPRIPPALLRFRVSESFTEREFIDVGRECARIIDERMAERGGLPRDSRVLDFGCGCGRTARWMLESHPTVEFHGSDVDRDAIDWCQAHLTGGIFRRNAASPPLNYPASYFDAIYCVSVFTHLNEEMQDAWLAELRRILKPGGVIVLTVHGGNATRGLADADRAALQAKGFLHRASRKMSGLLPDWYHTTWHSREYILAKVESVFGSADYVEIADGLQDCVTGGAPACRAPKTP